VIGIDDWAWKRNHRYGTLICDLERQRTIALLPDREPTTAQAWLSSQPQIEIVTRDRGGAYALAAARALPDAIQVADRWHLMENASQAFLAATRGCMRQIRAAHGAVTECRFPLRSDPAIPSRIDPPCGYDWGFMRGSRAPLSPFAFEASAPNCF
jgi:transposase